MENQPKLVRHTDSGGLPLAGETGCTAPGINVLLTAYCFGRAEPAEALRVAEHLPVCTVCRHEAERLLAAVRVLETDRSLLQTLTPAGVAGAFGVSGKLPEPFGGHRGHVWFASGIYALLGGLCLVLEFAYEFRQYAWPGLLWATLVGLWLLGTTGTALWCDWKLTFKGNVYGLAVAMSLVAVATVALLAAAYLFLPAHSITKLTDAAQPAQLAFQKDLIYHLIFLFFGLPALHCVWWLQRELAEGHRQNIFGLLTGERRNVAPRGLLFPRFWLLVAIALFLFVYTIYSHFNLMSKLQPVANYILFASLLNLRLVCLYILMARGLYWYAAQLNELKRECLIAERLKRAGLGKSEA